MGFLDFFKNAKQNIIEHFTRWRELGTYTAVFSSFGRDAYRSYIVRMAIRPLAEHTSKANARCSNEKIERILNLKPNMYMTGKDFLAKVRNIYELKNTAFIYIHRDDTGHADGFYPVPYASFEALDYMGGLFIRFRFNGDSAKELVCPWEDLAVLRKDYNESDIAGDSNTAVLPLLELINTTDQGIANAVKATANLRGILKSTKSMLAPDDIRRQKDDFVKEYLNLENEGGIASLDSTQEFTPIKMEPVIATHEQRKAFRDDVFSYFGVSESIVNSDYTEAQMEAFYDARIEPFLVALSLELTRKCFTDKEIGFKNHITYESGRLQFASTATKLNMVQLVDRALMTPNEYRMMFGFAPYEGGDAFVLRLDTAKTGDETGKEGEGENGKG